MQACHNFLGHVMKHGAYFFFEKQPHMIGSTLLKVIMFRFLLMIKGSHPSTGEKMLGRITESSLVPPRDHNLAARHDGGCDESSDRMHIQDNGGVSGINKAGPVLNMLCRNPVNSGSDLVVLPMNSDSQDSSVQPRFPESCNGISFSSESSSTTVGSSESSVSSVAEPLRVKSTSSSCTTNSVCDGTLRVSLSHLSAVKNHERFSDTSSINPIRDEEEISGSTLSHKCEIGDME